MALSQGEHGVSLSGRGGAEDLAGGGREWLSSKPYLLSYRYNYPNRYIYQVLPEFSFHPSRAMTQASQSAPPIPGPSDGHVTQCDQWTATLGFLLYLLGK